MLSDKIIVDMNKFLAKRKISKTEFSTNLGCPHSTVSRWLNGHTRVSPAWEFKVREFIRNYGKKK